MRRSATALLAVALLAVTGCASTVGLRVPAYVGPPIAGRLLVVAAGPVAPTAEALAASGFADAQAFEEATWEAFRHGLSEAYLFTNVQTEAMPDSVPLAPVFLSRQVVNEGRADNRWKRLTAYLPATSFQDAAAEYVLVVDTVYVTRQMGTDMGGGSRLSGREMVGATALGVATGLLTGVAVVPTSKRVRGSAVRARFALYRVGNPVPLIVDEIGGFGGGPDGAVPEGAWWRSLHQLANSLEQTGRFATR